MSSGEEARLMVEGGRNDAKEISLAGRSTLMGRQSDNDVVVDEAGVSRRHAKIVETDGEYYLSDLSSTNGTFVNGKEISEDDYCLNDGDRIRVGTTTVSYVFRSRTAGTVRLRSSEGGQESPDGDEAGPARSADDGHTAQFPRSSDTEKTQQHASSVARDDLFEGPVRLIVQVRGGMGLMVTFTQQLGDLSDIRILRLVQNNGGGLDISLVVRQPVPLLLVLADLDGVAQVKATRRADAGHDAEGALVNVTLKDTTRPSLPAITLPESLAKQQARVAAGSSRQPTSSSPVAPTTCVYCKEPLEPRAAICPSCRRAQA